MRTFALIVLIGGIVACVLAMAMRIAVRGESEGLGAIAFAIGAVGVVSASAVIARMAKP